MGHTYCSGSQEEWNCTYLWRFQGQYKSSFTTLSVFQRQHHTTLQQVPKSFKNASLRSMKQEEEKPERKDIKLLSILQDHSPRHSWYQVYSR